MPCNIDARAGPAASKTGTWLAVYLPGAQALGGGAVGRPCLGSGVLGFEGRPYGKDHTDHLQQELLILVAARLAAGEVLRPGVRGGRHRPRRCVGSGGNPAAVVVDPGAVPAP